MYLGVGNVVVGKVVLLGVLKHCLIGLLLFDAGAVDDDDSEGSASHSDNRPVVPSLSLPLPESLLCIRW